MSVSSVARKDFTSVRRSPGIWAGAILLGVLGVLVAYAVQDTRSTPTEVVQQLFQLVTQLVGVLLPILALSVSYFAIAGERERGGIKFLLGFPNTRRDVFTGKLLSRGGIVAGFIGFLFLATTSMAVTQHGVFPVGVILGTFALTLVYGFVFVSIGVAVSAAVSARGRAIAAAFGSYFGLVILYILPVVQVKTIVRWIHVTLLGFGENPDLYNAVQYTSPFLAYTKATNLVMPAAFHQRPFRDSTRNINQAAGGTAGASGGSGPEVDAVSTLDLPVYLTDEFSLVILSAWLLIPLVIGYWAFERRDLE